MSRPPRHSAEGDDDVWGLGTLDSAIVRTTQNGPQGAAVLSSSAAAAAAAGPGNPGRRQLFRGAAVRPGTGRVVTHRDSGATRLSAVQDMLSGDGIEEMFASQASLLGLAEDQEDESLLLEELTGDDDEGDDEQDEGDFEESRLDLNYDREDFMRDDDDDLSSVGSQSSSAARRPVAVPPDLITPQGRAEDLLAGLSSPELPTPAKRLEFDTDGESPMPRMGNAAAAASAGALPRDGIPLPVGMRPASPKASGEDPVAVAQPDAAPESVVAWEDMGNDGDHPDYQFVQDDEDAPSLSSSPEDDERDDRRRARSETHTARHRHDRRRDRDDRVVAAVSKKRGRRSQRSDDDEGGSGPDLDLDFDDYDEEGGDRRAAHRDRRGRRRRDDRGSYSDYSEDEDGRGHRSMLRRIPDQRHAKRQRWAERDRTSRYDSDEAEWVLEEQDEDEEEQLHRTPRPDPQAQKRKKSRSVVSTGPRIRFQARASKDTMEMISSALRSGMVTVDDLREEGPERYTAENPRRSNRIKFAPLAHWRGEHFVFSRRSATHKHAMHTISEVVVVPQTSDEIRREQLQKARDRRIAEGKSAPRRKAPSAGAGGLGPPPDEGIPVHRDVGKARAQVFDPQTASSRPRSAVAKVSLEGIPMSAIHESGDGRVVRAGTFLDFDEFSIGKVTLGPRAVKPHELAQLATEVFFVLRAPKNGLLLQIDSTAEQLSQGQTFHVPQGSMYSLKNLSRKSDVELLFTLVKSSSVTVELESLLYRLATQEDVPDREELVRDMEAVLRRALDEHAQKQRAAIHHSTAVASPPRAAPVVDDLLALDDDEDEAQAGAGAELGGDDQGSRLDDPASAAASVGPAQA